MFLARYQNIGMAWTPLSRINAGTEQSQTARLWLWLRRMRAASASPATGNDKEWGPLEDYVTGADKVYLNVTRPKTRSRTARTALSGQQDKTSLRPRVEPRLGPWLASPVVGRKGPAVDREQVAQRATREWGIRRLEIGARAGFPIQQPKGQIIRQFKSHARITMH